MDYIIQENTWSSSGSTSQRMKRATSKVFLGDESKSIYIVTEFHASDKLLVIFDDTHWYNICESVPGSDLYNHFTCMFLVSIDRKFPGDYEYAS